MILVYTGAQRSASTVLQSQEARTKSGSNADYLREMYEMTRVGTTILESEGDDLAALGRFAELLDHGWKLKQQLSTAVTTSAIDDLYKAGKELGAKGGKLLGAGGGGFVLFMVDPNLHPAFEERFGRQNIIPISMTNGGSTVAWVS
jgi:D-glycero-alpha-D-manno-heptose-7-phosphate kinase